MQVTTFGLFWLILLAYSPIKGQKALVKTVMFSAMFQAGAIIIVADRAISPLTISCIAFIADFFLRYKFKLKLAIPRFFKTYAVFWIIIFCEAIISSLLFKGLNYMEPKDWISYAQYDGHIALFGLFTLLIYGVTILLLFNIKDFTYQEIENLIDVMVFFVLIVGIWHFCTVMNYIPRSDFIRDFIYSNSTTTDNIAYFVDTNPNLRIYQSIFGIRFCGPFMEPSYCAGFLAMAFAFYVGKDKLTYRDTFFIAAILIMAVLTYSATAYISVAFAGILSAIFSGKVKQLFKIAGRGIALISVALVVITIYDLWDTVERLIINKADSHSAFIRGLWNSNAIVTFFDTFGIGMGYSNVRGSSLLFTLLASCGLIGTLFFSFFIFTLIQCNKKYKYKGGINNRFQIMFASTLFAMIVAISVMDYSVFWLSAILLVLVKRDYRSDNISSLQFNVSDKNSNHQLIGGSYYVQQAFHNR